jgi:UDP-N-acetyl-2-amino-2-deoxyglucuronate dehydrogenase
VTEVRALAETRIRDIEAEDTALAVLRFASGLLGTVEAATTIYGGNLEESISVFGENGYAVIGGATANWIKHWSCMGMSSEESQKLMAQVEEDPYGMPGHLHIIEDMVAAIEQDREPSVTVADGIRSIRLIHDMLQDGQRQGNVEIFSR